MNKRHTKVYAHIEARLSQLKGEIQKVDDDRKQLYAQLDDEGRKATQSESLQIQLESAWKAIAEEEVAFLAELLNAKPTDLITQLRSRLAFIKRELRELNSDEPEGSYSEYGLAGENQAYEEQYNNIVQAIL